MAAPSGITWGSVVTGTSSTRQGRIGIYTSLSTSTSSTTVSVQVWFWTMYSCSDTNNTVYFNWGSTSASSSVGSANINHTVSSGGSWSTANQSMIYSTSKSYNRSSTNQTVNIAAALGGIEIIPTTMRHNVSVTIPAIQTHTVSYNANGGSGAPAAQTKVYGYVLTLSSQVPTRSGYKFLGWGTSSTDTTPDYQPGGQYGADANITLYAIWERAELVDFTISVSSLSIPANSAKSRASVPSKSFSISPVGSSAIRTTNFYVRLRTRGGTTISTNGPYTIANNSTISLSVPSANILSALQEHISETQVQFQVQVCTGANSFESAITTTKTLTIPLTNFNFLRILKAESYRDLSNGNKDTFKITYSYSSSFGNLTGCYPSIKCIESNKTYSTFSSKQSSYSTSGSVITETMTVVGVSASPTVSTNVTITLTDGISTDTVNTIMIATTVDRTIYIYKADKSCEALEFVEDDFSGFDKYGKVRAEEFYEIGSDVTIGANMEFGEIVEREFEI